FYVLINADVFSFTSTPTSDIYTLSLHDALPISTRAKIDLFPEYIRHLPPSKGTVWEVAGRVLRSKELETAFVQKLAPGLKRRFGENFGKVSMYPVPILTRDIPGSRIFKHTDSLWNA